MTQAYSNLAKENVFLLTPWHITNISHRHFQHPFDLSVSPGCHVLMTSHQRQRRGEGNLPEQCHRREGSGLYQLHSCPPQTQAQHHSHWSFCTDMQRSPVGSSDPGWEPLANMNLTPLVSLKTEDQPLCPCSHPWWWPSIDWNGGVTAAGPPVPQSSWARSQQSQGPRLLSSTATELLSFYRWGN